MIFSVAFLSVYFIVFILVTIGSFAFFFSMSDTLRFRARTPELTLVSVAYAFLVGGILLPLQQVVTTLGKEWPCWITMWESYLFFLLFLWAYGIRGLRLGVSGDKVLRQKYGKFLSRKAMFTGCGIGPLLAVCVCTVLTFALPRYSKGREELGEECGYFFNDWAVHSHMLFFVYCILNVIAGYVEDLDDMLEFGSELHRVNIIVLSMSIPILATVFLDKTGLADTGTAINLLIGLGLLASIFESLVLCLVGRDNEGHAYRFVMKRLSVRRARRGATMSRIAVEGDDWENVKLEKYREKYSDVEAMMQEPLMNDVLIDYVNRSMCHESYDFLREVQLYKTHFQGETPNAAEDEDEIIRGRLTEAEENTVEEEEEEKKEEAKPRLPKQRSKYLYEEKKEGEPGGGDARHGARTSGHVGEEGDATSTSRKGSGAQKQKGGGEEEAGWYFHASRIFSLYLAPGSEFEVNVPSKVVAEISARTHVDMFDSLPLEEQIGIFDKAYREISKMLNQNLTNSILYSDAFKRACLQLDVWAESTAEEGCGSVSVGSSPRHKRGNSRGGGSRSRLWSNSSDKARKGITRAGALSGKRTAGCMKKGDVSRPSLQLFTASHSPNRDSSYCPSRSISRSGTVREARPSAAGGLGSSMSPARRSLFGSTAEDGVAQIAPLPSRTTSEQGESGGAEACSSVAQQQQEAEGGGAAPPPEGSPSVRQQPSRPSTAHKKAPVKINVGSSSKNGDAVAALKDQDQRQEEELGNTGDLTPHAASPGGAFPHDEGDEEKEEEERMEPLLQPSLSRKVSTQDGPRSPSASPGRHATLAPLKTAPTRH